MLDMYHYLGAEIFEADTGAEIAKVLYGQPLFFPESQQRTHGCR